jgi:hypothetical protein
LEQQLEMARLQGMGFKFIFWGKYTRHATIVGFVALLTALALAGEFTTIGLIAAFGSAVGLLWRISHEHLTELRRKRRRTDMPFKSYDGDM